MFSAFKKIISPSKTSEESVALESSEQGLGKSGPSRSRAGRREARHAETPYSAKGSNRRQSFFSGIVQKLNPFSPSPSSTPARVASDNDDENDEMVETVEPIVREQPAQKTLGAGSKKLKMTLIEESSDFLKTDTFAAADAEFQALVQTFQPPIQPFTEPLPKEPVSLSSSASFTFNNPLGKVPIAYIENRYCSYLTAMHTDGTEKGRGETSSRFSQNPHIKEASSVPWIWIWSRHNIRKEIRSESCTAESCRKTRQAGIGRGGRGTTVTTTIC